MFTKTADDAQCQQLLSTVHLCTKNYQLGSGKVKEKILLKLAVNQPARFRKYIIICQVEVSLIFADEQNAALYI